MTFDTTASPNTLSLGGWEYQIANGSATFKGYGSTVDNSYSTALYVYPVTSNLLSATAVGFAQAVSNGQYTAETAESAFQSLDYTQRNLFAYYMLVIIPTILLYNFVTSTYLFNSIGGDKKTSEMYAFATDSGLLKANYSSTDSSKIIGVGLYAFADTKDASSIEGGQTQAGYQEYYSRFWYYYTTFLYQDSTTNHRAVALQDTYKTDFTADQYYTYAEVALMGLPKEPEKITVLTEANLTGTSPYFKYALNDAGTAVDIHKMPILQDLFQSKVDSGTASALTSLNTYFYDASSSTATGLYANAVYDLTGQASTSVQTYYSERLNTVNYDIWLCLIVAFLPLQLIFFVIIPFTNKNEQTIGKMIFSLSVVKIDGFQTGIKEKLLHQLFVAMMGLLVILPWTMIGITCYFLLAVVDYMSFSRVVLREKRERLHFSASLQKKHEESCYCADGKIKCILISFRSPDTKEVRS